MNNPRETVSAWCEGHKEQFEDLAELYVDNRYHLDFEVVDEFWELLAVYGDN